MAAQVWSERVYATGAFKGISERKDQEGCGGVKKERKKQETGVVKKGKKASLLPFPCSTFLYVCAQWQSVKQTLPSHSVESLKIPRKCGCFC